MSDDGMSAGVSQKGVQGLFSRSASPIEQLPMLRVAFERVAAALIEQLRGLMTAQPQVVFQAIEGGTAEQILSPHEGVGVLGMLSAPKWDTQVVVVAQGAAVFAVLEMILGGDGSEPPTQVERPFSKIEVRIAGLLFERLASALAASFAPIAETPFVFGGTVDKLDFDAIGRPASPVVSARLQIEVSGRAGDVWIVIPAAALEPMRKTLSMPPAKPAAKADPRWSQQIQNEVTRASVTLSAVLDECPGLLGDISTLHPGQIIELGTTAHSRVRVECNNARLLWCHLGKSNGVYTLRVDAFVDREQEFMDDILAS
jgi:flagellar motor switch protein FliM